MYYSFLFFIFYFCHSFLLKNPNIQTLISPYSITDINLSDPSSTTSLFKKNIIGNNIIDSCKFVELNKETEFFNNKKLITISPGGYKGFYTHGICLYIKEKYNLDNYLFSGASAGSWNALFMTCKKDFSLKSKYIIESTTKNTKNLFDLQKKVKENILEYYTTDDFDLEKLFIGVTTLHNFRLKTTIYSNFCNLEDAIDCCFASSHIPFITGNIFNKYKNIISFDGGFSNNPYFDSIKSDFHISPNLWDLKNNNPNNVLSIDNITSLFSKNKYECNKLFIDGYNDAINNKVFLDNIFLG